MAATIAVIIAGVTVFHLAEPGHYQVDIDVDRRVKIKRNRRLGWLDLLPRYPTEPVVTPSITIYPPPQPPNPPVDDGNNERRPVVEQPIQPERNQQPLIPPRPIPEYEHRYTTSVLIWPQCTPPQFRTVVKVNRFGNANFDNLVQRMYTTDHDPNQRPRVDELHRVTATFIAQFPLRSDLTNILKIFNCFLSVSEAYMALPENRIRFQDGRLRRYAIPELQLGPVSEDQATFGLFNLVKDGKAGRAIVARIGARIRDEAIPGYEESVRKLFFVKKEYYNTQSFLQMPIPATRDTDGTIT